MNKKQEYEQLCRIRNVLLIAAILLAFAAAVVGVSAKKLPGGDPPAESTVETVEETTVDPAAETRAPESTSAGETEAEQITSEYETAEPEEHLDDETEATTEPSAEPEEQADPPVDEEMDLEDVLSQVLYDLPETTLEQFENYAQQIIPNDYGSWEKTARIQAEAWFYSLIDAEGSNALQQQAADNWAVVQEKWSTEDSHSEKAEHLYAFLDAFFADMKHIAEGGRPVWQC